MKPAAIFIERAGSLLRPIDRHEEEKVRAWPEKAMLKAILSRPRRQKNHAHFFAAIAAATDHWPDGMEPDPNGNSERLRAWLLCKAGYCDFIDFPVEASSSVIALIEKFRGDGRHAFVRVGSIGGEPTLRVFYPKSIAWDELDETAFVEVKQAVCAVIHAIIGVPADQLVRGTEEAA